MVHQPLGKDSIFVNMSAYEGVTYVEPHLLPCTVCHKKAPADYEARMLAMENRLPALVAQITDKLYGYQEDHSTPVE